MLIQRIRVETYWTNLETIHIEEILNYKDQVTSEHLQSQLKTEKNIEKLHKQLWINFQTI